MTGTDDPLAALRGKFLARCSEDLVLIDQALSDFKADPGRRPDGDFQTIIHRLAGTAGVFGYAEVSALALPIDEALHAGLPIPPGALGALAAALKAIL